MCHIIYTACIKHTSESYYNKVDRVRRKKYLLWGYHILFWGKGRISRGLQLKHRIYSTNQPSPFPEDCNCTVKPSKCGSRPFVSKFSVILLFTLTFSACFEERRCGAIKPKSHHKKYTYSNNKCKNTRYLNSTTVDKKIKSNIDWEVYMEKSENKGVIEHCIKALGLCVTL